MEAKESEEEMIIVEETKVEIVEMEEEIKVEIVEMEEEIKGEISAKVRHQTVIHLILTIKIQQFQKMK